MLLCLLCYVHMFGNAQNFVTNGDFELFNAPPTAQGQADFCTDWDLVGVSADYLNTTFPGWTPQVGGAYSGTGYMGFALYGTAVPGVEAIGQDISANPLQPFNSYIISVRAKKTTTGFYSQNCGGVAVYGYNVNPPLGQLNLHPQTSPTAELLFSSPTITSTTWVNYSGFFFPTQPTNYLVFTIDPVPNCPQYIFIDSVVVKNAITLDMGLHRWTSQQVEGQVELNWEADPGQKFAEFTVEHSTDGQCYRSLEHIRAQRNTAYHYTHSSPSPGPNFYRIKMVDVNGKIFLSEVLREDLIGPTEPLLFPNPLPQGAALSIAGIYKGRPVSVTFFDLTGREVLREQFSPGALSKQATLSTQHLPAGTYLYRISSEDVQAQGKIQVLK